MSADLVVSHRAQPLPHPLKNRLKTHLTLGVSYTFITGSPLKITKSFPLMYLHHCDVKIPVVGSVNRVNSAVPNLPTERSGAEEGTRTPTAFRPPAPKAGASANFATSAANTCFAFSLHLTDTQSRQKISCLPCIVGAKPRRYPPFVQADNGYAPDLGGI